MQNSNQQVERGKVTICVVNYKTEDLTRLCLRSIRQYTEYPYEVIVVDNGSNDSSLEYLRSVSWIKLIERSPDEMKQNGSWAHGSALDIGLKACNTEYFMALHSDTLVHKKGWLSELVKLCPQDTACTGGGKLDLKPKWEIILKQCTDYKKWLRQMRDKNAEKFYIRTICALYRSDILKKEKMKFYYPETKLTCGKQLYLELLERGYKTHVLSPWQMSEYIYHLAHATMVLNPEFSVRRRTEKKCKKQLERIFSSPIVKEIMQDGSLDS
ncbi:glycosyltransferase [Lentisphaerota bacterium ZTH]|nr:glycosyltransferase [Lentisphaerota bacterium]WET05433.1 glycosyltransferase [Lentisphaerota bacterium ZTH]